MLNLTKTQKICIQYGFLLLLICMTVYLVSTTLDITLIPMIMKLVNKKFIFIGFLIMVLYIILECTIINILKLSNTICFGESADANLCIK